MYAEVAEVEAGFRTLTADERNLCQKMLEEADVIIDAYGAGAAIGRKKIVSCRMVRRALGDGDNDSAFPIGATQGSMSALGYSQSWQYSGGGSGELYLSKLEKKLLGVSERIGARSPLEDLTDD